VIDAGSQNGFIPGAHQSFSTKKKPQPGDDYHGDLNGPSFLKWFKTKLLPNLKNDSVICMDNAAYHRIQVETMDLVDSHRKYTSMGRVRCRHSFKKTTITKNN